MKQVLLKKNHLIILMGMLLVLWASFIIYKKAAIEIDEVVEQTHYEASLNFNITKIKLESYLNNLQDKIQIESYKHAGNIREIYEDPEANYERLESFQKHLKNFLPDANHATLTNVVGEPLSPNFDGYMGDLCLENVRNFTNTNKYEIRVHPSTEGFHFDIMIKYRDIQTDHTGVFFTSFKTKGVTAILKAGQVNGNQLFLILKSDLGLIEVSAVGNRLEFYRATKLSEQELKRISINQQVANTSWVLVNVTPAEGVDNEVNDIVISAIVSILLLYIVSGVMFFTIIRETIRRQRVSSRYQVFLDKTEIGLVVFDADKNIIDCNHAFKDLVKADSLIAVKNTSMSNWLPESAVNEVLGCLEEVDEYGQKLDLQLNYTSDENEQIILQLDIIADLDLSGAGKKYLLFCKDLSLSYKLDKLNAEKQAAIISNEAKSEFLANISHELRTPMHGILSYAAMGVKRINKVPLAKLEDYFKNIRASGDRLLVLLNSLLDLSKLEAGQMEMNYKKVDLLWVIDSALKEQNGKSDSRGLKMSFDETPEVSSFIDKEIVLEIDPGRITQVFANLISNAIKFTPENENISIYFQDSELQIDNEKVDAISIFVCNDGEGISEDELELIFEKFKQSKKQEGEDTGTVMGSTGLGLAICKEIISIHRGTIRAFSTQGENATFVVTLPLTRPIEND
ncbi:MAG: PAS domain-containing sensor histidine kinase [Sulfuriflexus sp.]|nr:PAS domain-containing sensor histidine kinase [Sulfuriflexus sp.]